MQTDDVSVRLLVLDGTWESLGADRAVGVVPESVVLSSNNWGADKASFDLRRDPGASWPDLQAFTPVEIEVGGSLVWTGRIAETPARDGDDPIINVQCEGWQYHLDDDVYADFYIHTRLGDWVDHRSLLTSKLAWWRSYGQVSNERGIMLASPNGTAVSVSDRVGVTLDLGPYARAKRVVVNWEAYGANTAFQLYCRGHSIESEADDTSVENGFTPNLAVGPTTSVGVFTTPRRYVTLMLHCSSAGTISADVWVRLLGVAVYAADAYYGGFPLGLGPTLKATQVVLDAKTKAAPLLAADTSRVESTSFVIPDLHFEREPRTPREVLEGVNAFHNYLLYVDADKRLVFGQRPSAAIFEVGNWGGSQFEDSAMNAGQDVYNRVLITGAGPDGSPVLVDRAAAAQGGVPSVPSVSPSSPNPSADANTTGWTGVVRDTATYDSAPASFTNTSGGGGLGTGSIVHTFSGTFRAGSSYLLNFRWKANQNAWAYLVGGAATDRASVYLYADSVFTTYAVAWTPLADYTSVTLTITGDLPGRAAAGQVWIDTLQLFSAAATIVDRRGFRRTKVLPIQAALTNDVAGQIGDVYLAAHKTQPLRGSLTVRPGGVRRVLTGEEVHPAALLCSPNQLVRLSHRIDPDTGALGRNGTIASISYSHAERTSTVALDSERRNFETLLSRLSVIQSSRGV